MIILFLLLKSFEEGELGFGVELVGDDNHEFCGKSKIFFYIFEKVFVGEVGYPNGIFDADEIRFLKKITQRFAFVLARLVEVKDNDPPHPVPALGYEHVRALEAQGIELRFALLGEAEVAPTART